MVSNEDRRKLRARVAQARYYVKNGLANPAHEAIAALADEVDELTEEIERLRSQITNRTP